MKYLILAAALVSTSAFAVRDVELTPACEASLKEFALTAENNYLATKGETLASKLEADVFMNYWPAKEDVNVSVQVTDAADGRSVNYRTKTLKTEALACKIQLKRVDASYCRYSTGDGPDGLNQIKGLAFTEGKTIPADAKLTKLEAEQIRAFLAQKGENKNVKELIESTDDRELSTGTLTLPNGKTLTYFGAYGGDNPYGIFFEAGTAKAAGANGDGSVCIQ